MNNNIKGKYKFLKNYTTKVCGKYQGSMGVVNPCIEYKYYDYNVGDVIDVQNFYFDKEWGGKLPIQEQNLGVPMSYLEKVSDTTPVSKERVRNGDKSVLCNNGLRDVTNGAETPCSGAGAGGVATNQNPQSQNNQVSFLQSHPKLIMTIFIGIGLYIGYKKFIK